jgi:hypothetical protein
VVASENMINKSGVENKGNSLVVPLLGVCFFKNKILFHHQQKKAVMWSVLKYTPYNPGLD